jgi:hypothetical protein
MMDFLHWSTKYIGLGLSLLQTFAEAVNENEYNENGNETKKAVASAKDPKGPLRVRPHVGGFFTSSCDNFLN